MITLGSITIPILGIHIAAVILALSGIIITDREAYLWMRGKKETLTLSIVLLHHRLMWGVLLVLIVTGTIMAWPAREYFFTVPAFYFKMAFVITLVVNSFVIAKLIPIAGARAYRTLSKQEKRPLFISGAVSFVSWFGAIIAAFNLT